MGTSRRLLAILPLVALAIAGCGGGSGDDSTAAAPVETTEATTALSKEELIAQGDAICAEENAAIGRAAEINPGARGSNATLPDLYAGMVVQLKGLGAPSDDSSGYPEFIAAAEQLGQAWSDAGLAAEREEEEAVATAESEAASALSSFQSAATAYGFKECGEAPSAPAPSASAEEAGGEEPSEGVEEEVAPEVEEEVAPETGGGVAEEEGAGGGAGVGGGTGGGTEGTGGGSSAGGIGPG